MNHFVRTMYIKSSFMHEFMILSTYLLLAFLSRSFPVRVLALQEPILLSNVLLIMYTILQFSCKKKLSSKTIHFERDYKIACLYFFIVLFLRFFLRENQRTMGHLE